MPQATLLLVLARLHPRPSARSRLGDSTTPRRDLLPLWALLAWTLPPLVAGIPPYLFGVIP
jgi:hypothetical protein